MKGEGGGVDTVKERERMWRVCGKLAHVLFSTGTQFIFAAVQPTVRHAPAMCNQTQRNFNCFNENSNLSFAFFAKLLIGLERALLLGRLGVGRATNLIHQPVPYPAGWS